MKPSIPLGRRFWALTKSERRALKELLKSDSARELITALKGRREVDRIEVLDAALDERLQLARPSALRGARRRRRRRTSIEQSLPHRHQGGRARRGAARAGCRDAARQRRARRRGGARAFAELGGADDGSIDTVDGTARTCVSAG